MAEDRRKKALEILSNGNRQANVSNAQKTTAFAPSADISGRRKKALDILAGNNTDRKTESQTKTWSQMIDEYNADIDRRKKTEGQAKSSTVSFDEKGNVSPWQTLLNIGSDLKKISGTEEEQAERAKTLSDKRDRRVEEYKAKGYNTIWLFGREYILGKIKDEDISEEEKKEKSESVAKWEARNEVDRKEIENISTAVEAAKKLGQQGIPTYAVKGSKTQQSVDDFQNKYAGKSFGEKLRSNVGITAGNWALDISSAALSGADLLTGGQLGKGKLGKASSVYSVLNLAQSGASGLAGNAFGIMRENSSFLGKLVLDIEKSGVEQILDRLTGGGLATMGVRVAGGSLQQGEDKGQEIGKNILTTAVRTGIEVFTEMMSGIGGSYTGKGWGDSILDALNRKIAAKTGSELLGTLAEAFGGEAVEEMTSDILNPIFDWIFGLEGEEYEGALDFIGSTLYDGLVGGLSGMTGGVGTAAMDRFSARQLGADIATYKVAQHIVESDRLRKNFEKATGVLLSEDEGKALVQTAVVLTAMSENRKQTRNADRNIRGRKTEVIEEILKKLGVSERAAKIIRTDFLFGDAAPETFAHGVEEAFTYGKNGISLEETMQRGSFINDLSEVQARHAYELGQMTRNTRTEEQNSAENGDMEGAEESTEPNAAEELTVESAAASYGEGAEKFIDAFGETPEADIEEFARDFKKAYNFGLSGLNKTSLTGAETLTESQRETAYAMGRAKSSANAKSKQEKINDGKQSGNRHREGTVRGDGVKLADLRAHFNDKQNTAYRFLATFAKISGIDIVLYKSEADENGKFTAPEGRFEHGENTIYIDINAGLENVKDVSSLANYTMLRTFSHEFTHFVEKWSPEQYNTLREFTFRYMDDNGKNVDSLIMDKMSLDESLSYEEASREVAAEGFADILPQSDVVERLAAEHESLYKSILRKMKEFVARIKAYFKGLRETTPEAQALKNGIKYADSIVKLWTDAGVDAVNSYNATFGEETSQSLRDNSPRMGAKGRADRGVISSYDNFTGEDADRTLDEYGGDLLSYEEDTEDEPEKRKVRRDRFPANDYTSREEEAPRLADRVPKKEAVSVAEMVETGNFEAEEETAAEKKEEKPKSRFSKYDKKELENGTEAVDQGRKDIRGGSSGRGVSESAGEVSKPESDIPGDRGSGETDEGDNAPTGGGNEARRNGSGDRAGDGDRLLAGGNAGNAGTLDGEDHAGVQRDVPVTRNTNNHRITEDIDSIRPNFDDNLAAIKLIKKLIEEGRKATPEERAILARYKGWGGLKNHILGYRGRELERILTKEEFQAAKDSILNAHYTSTKVISGIYNALRKMGFKGGKILEPSMGVGNFFGMLPQEMSEKSELYGVELDSITGQIAQQLYPDAKIDVAGFQDVLYPDNTFDVVVGNVPFSNDIKLSYRGSTYNLHDFFFVKALDEVREGGVMALITSTGTLDKLSGKTQAAIAKKANLLAAFRLPDNAFKTNAGTSVTTDLIFLQKRGSGVEDNGIAFGRVGTIDGIPINEYFVEHPENILGTLAQEKNMYGSDRTVVHATDNFEELFAKAMDSLPKNIFGAKKSQQSGAVKAKRRGESKKAQFVITESGAELVDSEGNSEKILGKAAVKVKDFVTIRELFNTLSELEKSGNLEAAQEVREKLNAAYDSFVRKHGTLASNKSTLRKDDSYTRISGLEIIDKNGNASKSVIFSRPTMYKPKKTSASTAAEGLSVSLNERGRVDVPFIAELTGKSEDEVADELSGEIIYTPDGEYELIAKYISGNIYKKLDALKGKKGFERQRKLLEAALPKPKTASEIDAELSSHWIPEKYMAQFLNEILTPYGGVHVHYIKETGQWTVDKFYSSVRKFTAEGISIADLVAATMNNKNVVINEKNADGKSVIDKERTEVAQNKQNDLRQAFRQWIFRDETRRKDLESIYNRAMNTVAPMNYDTLADKLNFGVSSASKIKLRSYQKEAAARIVFGGNTLLHHGVGTGKTSTMIAAAKLLKDTGIASKPMFVVPNGKVEDFKREILDMYPEANILALSDTQMTPKELQRTKSLIATNDWDYVLIYRTAFQKIGVSDAQTAAFIEEQLDALETAIREAKGDSYRNLSTRAEKGLISRKKNLEEKLKTILEKPKGRTTTFEDMGVDALFIDEAHNFKKVGFATTHEISGVDSETNQITTDLYLKERYMRSIGGRIVLATATPITNTVSEMYNMTLHVAPDVLKEAGIYSFDAWLNTFGNMETAWEISPDGKSYRQKERVQSFWNGNELVGLYRQFADVKQTQDVVEGLPKAEYITVISEATDLQKALMQNFSERFAKPHRFGDSGEDSILTINNDARAAATDIRLVFGALGSKLFPGLTGKEMDLPNSKINKAVANIVDEYMRSKKNKGTQFVFLDQGINDGGKRYSFNLYKDLINKLVASGIPRSEIANIGDYDGEAKRTELYEAMNTGKIRVLIGSTAKMGEGVNAQNKAVALHHLSVPYRPDNLEQREGRIIRHGNENENVRIYKYIQEGSYDSYLWQMIERKAKYMAQALNGGDASQLEEAGDAVVNAAEAKALATGNPKILDKLRLEDEVAKLRTLERAFFEEQRQAEKNAAQYKIALQSAEASLKQAEKTAETVRKNRTDSFSMEVAGKVHDKRADAAKALAKAYGGKSDALGKVFGLEMRRDIRSEEDYGVSIGSTRVQLGNSEEGNITRILNAVKDLENEPARIQRKIKELEIAIRDAEATAARESFPQAAELAEKTAELKVVNEELGITEKTAAFDAEKTQYSKRGNAEKYTYDWFASKPDMKVTSSNEQIPSSRAEIVAKAKENAASVGKTNSDGVPVVHVDDINTDVLIPKKSLTHGLDRRMSVQAPVLMRIGDVLKNSVRVNELNPRSENISNSYILIGALESNGYLYVASLVVNKYTNEVAEIDVLYSANAKKESAALLPKFTDKSATPTDSTISISELLEYVNEYFPDILPEDVLRHFGRSSRPDGTFANDVQFQQRGNSISDSDVLEYAVEKLDTAKLTDAERDALNIFKRDLERLRELEADRAEQGRIYKEQMFTKGGSYAEAVKAKNRMDILDKKINSLNNTLLMLQNKEVLRKILSQARTEVEGIERAKAKERLAAFKMKREDTESRRKYRKRVETEVTRLSDMLLKPADKNISKRVPAAIQKTVSGLLSSIDFSTPRLLKNEKEAKLSQKDKAFAKKLQAVQNAIKENIELKGAYSGYADLPPNFMEDFQKLIDGLNDLISTESENDVFVVNRMSAKQLKGLSSLLKDVRKYIENMNRFHENAIFQHAYEAGEDTVQHLRPISRAEQKKGPLTRIFNNFLAWQYMRPAVGFERFGKGGMSIYHEFRDGQATQAFLANKIIEFAKETYTEKQVREWSEKTVSVELDSGETVTMPVAMAMSFYELAKRPQAKTHIFGDGIRIAAFEDGKKLVQDEGHIITIEDAQRIGAALKDEQIKVADALQAFMRDECAAWGNYVTMARFEREVFGEEWYFPINSDGRYLAATAEESPDSAALYALLNMGFTKELKENAKNRIIIYNIFDVFANHAASMAQYRAFALPVLDALKWFNYSDGDTSVRDEMAKAFGVPTEKRPGSGNKGYAESFVLNLLKAYNGTTAHSDSYDAFGMKGLHRFNRAQVAYNLRVVAQQPLAITRAAMILSPAKLTKGLGMSATQLKKLAEEMEAHSGIAAWKKLGFYDTNISRGLTALIKHEETFGEKFTEVGMKGAELADRYTWAAMWYAAKDTISRADYSSEEAYFKAVTDLFEQVIYKTQVVDSVLTKSEFLRAQGFGARFLGSFMSEPSATVSMLMDGLYKYADDMARGMSRSTAWQRNKEFIGKTFLVYGVGQVLLAAVQSVADAWRDDDDYESFLEKLLEAFKGNVIDELNPIGKIPIAKDVIDLIKTALSKIGFDTYGNSISGGWMQYADYLIKSVEIFHGLKTKDDRMKYTLWGGIYNLLRGVAGMTGYPIATLSREVIDAWNNIVGAFRPDMKIKTYDPGDKNEIKYAYQDGYLTREEAMNELVRREISEDRNEAFFTVESWDSGELSVYAQLYEAAESGDTAAFNSEMRKLTTHGKKKEEVIQALRQHVRDGYLEGGMTASDTRSILTRFTDDSPEDADARLDNWDFSENNPSLDWEYATVNTYLSEIKPSGISMSVYDKYLKGYRKCTGEDANGDGKTDSGSKRKQVLSLIDSLDLTPEQKDVLYYKNNYAASRINEAPWR